MGTALTLLVLAGGGAGALAATEGSDPTALPEPAEKVAPLQIGWVDLLDGSFGTRIEVGTSGPLVWTSYRDEAGRLVIELPNSVPTPEVAGAVLRQGVVEEATIEVAENGDRPLTRLVVATQGPVEHSVGADGNRLMVDLAPIHTTPVPEVLVASLANRPVEPGTLLPEPSPLPFVDPQADRGTADNPLPGPPPTGVPATQLQAVEVSTVDDSTVVWILGDGEFYYSTFELDDPERFVLDLNGVVKTTATSTLSVDSSAVERIRVAQFKSRPDLVSRVVVDLRAAAVSEVEPTAEGLKLTFRAGAAPPVVEPPAAEPLTAELEEPAEPVEPAPVMAEPVEPAPAMAEPEPEPVMAEPEPVMAEPEPVEVRARQEAVMPAAPQVEEPAPAPPVEASDVPTEIPATLPAPETAVPAPAARGFEVTELGPGSPTQEAPGGFGTRSATGMAPTWEGAPITMTLKDADVKDVLRSFAQISGLNVVVQPGVSGTVTVELTNVPWDQALQQVLKINGLDYQLEGNIMRIAPVSVLRAEAEEQQRLLQAQALSIPLRTIIRRISYASANDIARVLRSGGGASILSARGSVIVDQRTNTLIIKELPSVINTVIAVIESLDIPEPQVIIEARIIETTKRFTRTIGVQWDFDAVASAVTGNTTGLQFPNNGQVQGGVNLLTGAANGFLDISLGNVLNTFRLDAVLQAAENEGLINILSAPKITTLNNERATIQSGLQIPIQTIANNTVSVQFINATLRLDVTPHVTASGTVLMDIDIQKREPQLAFAVAGAQNAPIATKDARTRVIVRDGGTAVIGGIYEVTSDQGEDRVPGLANIPIIKHLFKNKRRTDENEELLIFITPRVVKL